MAKTYLGSAKYEINIRFEVSGVVDKPDIVGAIFGQSEGLLGEEMDLKELQNSGKVGRIEIRHESTLGKTKGEILVPSSMDMVETSILAAAIESVDKVGPCDAKFTVSNIDDVRKAKRENIKSRAKELLERFKQQLPETDEMADEVREGTRAAEIIEYGPEKVPAGPDIDSEEEIIIVEGRADVLNLLRNNIKNAIAMGGAKIPQAVVDLCKRKQATVFVDGDRGGDLNARKLQQIAPVSFIARAPDGKEVEELARKEILLSLKRRQQALAEASERQYEKPYRRIPGRLPARRPYRTGMGRGRLPYGRDRQQRYPGRPFAEVSEEREEERLSAEEQAKFQPVLEGLKGTLKAKIFDEAMKELAEVEVRDLVAKLSESKGSYAVVFDGIITRRLYEEAEKAGLKYLIGIKKSKIEKGNTKAAALG